MARGISRRQLLKEGGSALVALSAWRPGRVEAAPAFDIVLKGGTVLDGTGAPAFVADLGLAGDAIGAVGEIGPGQGRRVIDVAGLHVCPGFIDMHSHSDWSILRYPGAESRAVQGITTEVTGNCGSSAAPAGGLGLEESRRGLAEEGVDLDWTDVASYFARVERRTTAVNQALLLGQGTLRENAIGPFLATVPGEGHARPVGRDRGVELVAL